MTMIYSVKKVLDGSLPLVVEHYELLHYAEQAINELLAVKRDNPELFTGLYELNFTMRTYAKDETNEEDL